MAEIVVLPQQGNSVEEVVLLDWKVAVGDSIAEGDVLCEVETDKATMEVESTASGTLLAQLADAGDEVPVKTAIAVVGEAGEDISGLDLGGADGGARTGSAAATSDATAGPAAPSPAEAPSTAAPAQAVGTTGPTGDHAVSPRARLRAAERGIDPTAVTGTGPGGRVIERDVLAAAANTTASARTAAAE